MKKLFIYFFLAVFYTVSALAAPASSRNVSVSRIVQKDIVENSRSESSPRGEKTNRTTRRSNEKVSENKNTVSRVATRVSSKEKERNNKSAVVSRAAVSSKKTDVHTKTGSNSVVTRAAQSNKQSRGKTIQSRASVLADSKKTKKITAESLADAKDVLEKTADLNKTCQQQYNECMDQFCAVVDTNQKRCSCSSNLSKYQKAQKAVEEASDELNDVAQRIRYVGLSADEIRAIMNATEAEQAMTQNRDNTETRSLLSDIEEMIKDPTANVSYTSSSNDSTLDMDFDFSAEASEDFSLDIFSTSSSTSSISNKRGKDLYNEAVKRCKSVLKSCKSAGGTESQITGNYDLAISKDCFEYEQGLQKLNTTLKNNVRSANLMLQKARLSVLQNKNQYDVKQCVSALETCMLDDMVCGADYIKCLDPTKNYIDENGKVVLGRDLSLITDIMQNYSNSKIDADFIKESENNTKCPQKDGACIVNYLMSKIGKGATVKDGGLCRAVLDKCQNYTYVEKGKSSEYNPYNTVIINYIQRAMVNIKAAQSKIIADYASTCMSQISECYNQQMTQLSSWTSNASAENIYNVLTGACYNVALTCGYAIYSYDLNMNKKLESISNDKEKKLTLIQAVSDLFYNQMLCPDNSFFTTISKDSANSEVQARYVNDKCVCKDGYKVYSTSCMICDVDETCANPTEYYNFDYGVSVSTPANAPSGSGNNSGSNQGGSSEPGETPVDPGNNPNSGGDEPVVNDTTYNIVYSRNDGTDFTYSVACSATNGCDLLDAEAAATAGITRENYAVIKWSKKANGESGNYSFGQHVTPGADLHLYAIWEREPYHNIVYSRNDGTDFTYSVACYVKNGCDLLDAEAAATAEITKENNSLIGWATSASATSADYTLEQHITPTSDLHLYAVWEPNAYNINYYLEKGDSTPKTTVKCPINGGCYQLSGDDRLAAGIVNSDYVFRRWVTSEGGEIHNLITPTSDMDLYPVWGYQQSYTVTYRSNTDNNISRTENGNSTCDVGAETCKIIFRTWNTNKAETEGIVNPGFILFRWAGPNYSYAAPGNGITVTSNVSQPINIVLDAEWQVDPNAISPDNPEPASSDEVVIFVNQSYDYVSSMIQNGNMMGDIKGTNDENTGNYIKISDNTVIQYITTNNYDGLKCYVANNDAYKSFCNDIGNHQHCLWADDTEQSIKYKPEMGTYAFYIGRVYDGDTNSNFAVFDAAGMPVNNIRTALSRYKDMYQPDFYYSISQNENYPDILYCFSDDMYFANVSVSDGSGSTKRLPINIYGNPLFSNLYLTTDPYNISGIDGYVVSFQTNTDTLSPAMYFYDFRNIGSGTTYIPALAIGEYDYNTRFNAEIGLSEDRFYNIGREVYQRILDTVGENFYNYLNSIITPYNIGIIPNGLSNVASSVKQMLEMVNFECLNKDCLSAIQLVAYRVDSQCVDNIDCYSFQPEDEAFNEAAVSEYEPIESTAIIPDDGTE